MSRRSNAIAQKCGSQEVKGESQPGKGLFLGLGWDYWILTFSLFIGNIMTLGFSLGFAQLYLRELGAEKAMIGLAFSLSTAVSAVFSPFGGYAGDVLGRKKMLLLGPIVAGTAYLLLWLAPDWRFALFGLILSYVPGVFVGPAFQAYIADVIDKEKLGRAYGIIPSVLNISGIIGPAIVGLLITNYGYREAILATALVTFVSGAARLMIRETIPPGAAVEWRKIPRRILLPLKSSLMRPVVFIRMIYFSAWGVAYTFMSLLLKEILLYDVGTITVILVVRNAVYALASPLAGRISERYSRRALLAINILGRGVFLVLLISQNVFWQLLLLVIFENVITTFLVPITNSLLAVFARKEERGAVFGSLQSLQGLASIPAPWIGGLLWESVSPLAPFYASAVAIFILFGYASLAIPSKSEVEKISRGGEEEQVM